MFDSCVAKGLGVGALAVVLIPLALLILVSTIIVLSKAIRAWVNNKVRLVLEPKEKKASGSGDVVPLWLFIMILGTFIASMAIIIYLVVNGGG